MSEANKTEEEIVAAYEKLMADKKATVPGLIRIDIGCGKNKQPGFIGIDQFPMPGVDILIDLSKKGPWMFDDLEQPNKEFVDNLSQNFAIPMFPDNSVDEVFCSHFIEHLERRERVAFMNELYRVMKPGAKAMFIAPHWASNRAYGDMTHCWPPVCEMWLYYLSKNWRTDNCPHDDSRWNPEGYSCDFEASWGFSYHPALNGRNQEYIVNAQTFWKEACQDIQIQMTKLVEQK